MKSRETEGKFELYVTRTPGYLWALFFKKLHVHPIAVTLLSIVIGAAAGYFFWFPSLKMTLIGMLLLIWANWFDCADGQLARMTGQKTLIGRVLDGFAGDVWFFSIYFFICLRLMPELAPWGVLMGVKDPVWHGTLVQKLFIGGWWGIWIWLLCCFASRSHADQCALADYYRNIHLMMVNGKEGSELESTARISARFRSLKWRSRNWFEKLYLFFYNDYTRNQERMTPEFQKFLKVIDSKCGGKIPDNIRREFRAGSRPLMKYCNIITFDARVGILFVSLLIGLPWLYPVVELTVFQCIKIYLQRTHERLCRKMIHEITYGV